MFEIGSLPEQAPAVDAVTRPYFEGFARHQLLVPRCASGHYFWIPRPFCPKHMDAEVEPVAVSGRGIVYSFTVVHRGEGRFADAAPYVLAYVELVEGPRLMTNIVGCTEDQVEIGTAVEAVFGGGERDWALPRFAPRDLATSKGDNQWT